MAHSLPLHGVSLAPKKIMIRNLPRGGGTGGAGEQVKNNFTFLSIHYIHYDPLMMSQKEAPRKHQWVLPIKVAYLV